MAEVEVEPNAESTEGDCDMRNLVRGAGMGGNVLLLPIEAAEERDDVMCISTFFSERE